MQTALQFDQNPSVDSTPFARSPAPSIGPPASNTNVCAVICEPTKITLAGIASAVLHAPVPDVKPAAYGAEFGRSNCSVHDPNATGTGSPKLKPKNTSAFAAAPVIENVCEPPTTGSDADSAGTAPLLQPAPTGCTAAAGSVATHTPWPCVTTSSSRSFFHTSCSTATVSGPPATGCQ